MNVPRGEQRLRRYPASLGEKNSLSLVRTVCGSMPWRLSSLLNPCVARHYRGAVGGPPMTGDFHDAGAGVAPGRDDAALNGSREALVADALKDPIEHDDIRLFAPSATMSFLEQVVAQDIQAVAIALIRNCAPSMAWRR